MSHKKKLTSKALFEDRGPIKGVKKQKGIWPLRDLNSGSSVYKTDALTTWPSGRRAARVSTAYSSSEVTQKQNRGYLLSKSPMYGTDLHLAATAVTTALVKLVTKLASD